MLKSFKVKNFKNFKKNIILDFSATHDYEFSTQLIKNNLINKALIYGKNNTGKSNLGAAIMDITSHLTDNQCSNNPLYKYYINGDSKKRIAEFEYIFLFGDKEVTYRYKKNENMSLVGKEELYEGDTLLFQYNYTDNTFLNNIDEAKTLDLSKRNTSIPVLKFIFNNTQYWDQNSPVRKLKEFVDGMLWFRSLKSNEFMGIMSDNESLYDFIIKNNYLKKFESFLHDCGQDYNLCNMAVGSKQIVGVNFGDGPVPFDKIASTGTLSLWVFFYWMNRSNNVTFLYLDEFDAFYHFELAVHILNYINKREEFQSVLTSHNTYLIDNNIMRPDCYFKIANGEIKSLADSTLKKIRQVHNLEKMFLSKEFGD